MSEPQRFWDKDRCRWWRLTPARKNVEDDVGGMALVQTFGINATKRSGTLRGSCGENCVPDFGRPVVLDAKLSEFELTFPDSVHQFNAGDGN
jgi:hypothetical protein